MQMRKPALAAFTSVCLAATLAACGGAAKNAPTSTAGSSSTSSSASATSTKAAAPSGKLQPRNLQSTSAANPTIADYIKDQHITETPIHKGDPGAPEIDVQLPDGWQSAGDDTPDYAYGALVYSGPEAQGADYTPNIIALVSKLDGPVDQDKLLSLASGEMKNLPGFVAAGEGNATVSGFPAYKIAGGYDMDGGIKAASGQETVIIPGQQGLYVLQLNATSNDSQSKVLFDALEAIDNTIKITA